MIQFNLLPDVKLEFIKTRYRKRLIMGVSVITSVVFLVIFIILFLYVRVNQTKHMNDLTKDIQKNVAILKENPELDKVLTIQSQLNSLPDLHDKKVVSSRLVDYLSQLTPTQATISNVDVDYEESSITIKGNADSLITVNKFTDTLKFTDYKVNLKEPKEGKAFKSVVLKNFSIEPSKVGGNGSNTAIYEIEFFFEPDIFATIPDATDVANPVTLTVPKIISTRSETERPDQLFAPQPQTEQPQVGR